MLDLREELTSQYLDADHDARLQEKLLWLGFPSYRYIEERGLAWIKAILAIWRRRQSIMHVAKIIAHVEGVEKKRSEQAGADLAKMAWEDTKGIGDRIRDVSVLPDSGLLSALGTDKQTRDFVEKYNALMHSHPLAAVCKLPGPYGP